MTMTTESTVSVSVTVGDQEIVFETGKLAKQADGAVVVRSGETMVLATAQGRPEAREGADFFPLTVDVEERMYAAGKIPGGFFKREGRPTERAILTARMTDRPIRPLWPKGFRNEVQVICTVLSADLVTAHDILAINGASAALMISPLPFMGPVGAVRIGMVDGELVVNPTLPVAQESTLDLVVVGTKDALTMIEAGAGEIPEEKMIEAFELAHAEIRRICEAQEELQAKVGQAEVARPVADRRAARPARHAHRGRHHRPRAEGGLGGRRAARGRALPGADDGLDRGRHHEAHAGSREPLAAARRGTPRRRHRPSPRPVRGGPGGAHGRGAGLEGAEVGEAAPAVRPHRRGVELPFPVAPVPAEGEPPTVKDTMTKQYVKKAAEAIYKELVRHKIAVDGRRPDGRSSEEIRPVSCEVGVSPRTHGSALFTRGQTQIMSLLTLGTAKEGQRIDDLSLEEERRYMHHYNFPPYSVGETGFMRGPKRRDIGHGALAQRALEPVLPGTEDFPYTIRIVSETLESNGSSSMGSVCGSTLSLQDAGVPIKAPVSGISIGLIKEGDDYTILTDIQGAEDHLGDMDFKVAGTREGITALQMDCKISGVTQEIMRSALEQAKRARESILDTMAEVMPESRTELADHAPRISSLKINPEYIGMVIGKGGETIRSLESDYDVQIDIEEDGTILVYATEGTKATAAMEAITNLTKDPEVGDTFVERKVVKTTAVRRLRRAEEGHRRPAPRLERRPRPGRPHRGRHQPRRRARRDRAGGRQGARPHRPQAHREARERHARPARGAHRAGEERARASARGAPRPRPPRRPRRQRPPLARKPPGALGSSNRRQVRQEVAPAGVRRRAALGIVRAACVDLGLGGGKRDRACPGACGPTPPSPVAPWQPAHDCE